MEGQNVTLSGDKAFQKALGEMRKYGAIVEAAEAQRVMDVLKESQTIEGRFDQDWQDTRHWGVWHPGRGWWWKPGGELYVTRHKSLAQAQCSVVRRFEWSRRVKAEDYRVRCIEEWADERQAES